MALFRHVQTEFWKDPKVLEEMTPEDKLFFLYLLTNPSTTQIGIYKITKKQIAFEIGYSTESISSLVNRFENQHKVIKYNEETRELAIKNWGRYNLNKGGKPIIDCVKKEVSQVRDKSLLKYIELEIVKPEIKEIFKETYDTSTTRGQKEKEKEKEKENKKENIYKTGDRNYEKFYEKPTNEQLEKARKLIKARKQV